jgi:mannose-6-phosphate isomerase-like protein (cupin superfamily)
MRAGTTVVDDAEKFTIERSAANGGRCHFELELEPGAEGPPVHTHDELEDCEIISGEIVFIIDGVERTFRAGDKFVLPPGSPHTFRNPSKTEVCRARGTHSGGFERLIDQLAAGDPKMLRLALYATTVDPRAAYMVSPFVRALFRVLAFVARVRGVRIAPPTGAYGVDGNYSKTPQTPLPEAVVDP